MQPNRLLLLIQITFVKWFLRIVKVKEMGIAQLFFY